MAGLQSLANELLESICDHCKSLDELKSLRLVCVSVGEAVNKAFYARSKVNININRQTIDEAIPQIVGLSTGSSQVSGRILHLKLSNLSPKLDPMDEHVWVRGYDGCNRFLPKFQSSSSEVIQAAKDFEVHLKPALQSLVSLKSLEWHITGSDLYSAMEDVMSGISNLKTLNEISIHALVMSNSIKIPLERLPPMRVITATFRGSDPWSTFFEPLSKGVSHSHGLEKLYLDSGFGKHLPQGTLHNSDPPVFNDFIAECPSVLPLSDIGLIGWKVQTTTALIDRLRNIKTTQPFIWNLNGFEDLFLSHISAAGVHFENIGKTILTGAPNNVGILPYIGSYSGIRSLELDIDIASPPDDNSFHEIQQELCHALSAHKSSLEVLSIGSGHANHDSWLTGSLIFVLANCHILRELTIAIDKRHVTIRGSTDIDYKPLKCLVESFSFHPSIRTINLIPAGFNKYSTEPGGQLQQLDGTNAIEKCLQALAHKETVKPGAFRRDFSLGTAAKRYQFRYNATRNEDECILVSRAPVKLTIDLTLDSDSD